MPNILHGYDQEFNLLASIYNKKNLPNKILFSGKKGIGKSLLASHFINFIFSKNELNPYDINEKLIYDNNRSFNLVENKTHPNFFNIYKKKDKKFIEISQIRELYSFINKSSFDDNLKIVLIDDAESLTINASNSLLKLVEEPNYNVQFIIIQDNSKFILETLKSRCIEFKLTLNEIFIPKIVNQIHKSDIFDKLNNDFKFVYLAPNDYLNLFNFCNKNEMVLESATIEDVLGKIVNKSLYKFNQMNVSEIKLYLEIFIRKKYIQKKSTKYLEYSNIFNKKLSNVIKYNLDLETFFIELNNELVL